VYTFLGHPITSLTQKNVKLMTFKVYKSHKAGPTEPGSSGTIRFLENAAVTARYGGRSF
jgi:hypothetical protein